MTGCVLTDDYRIVTVSRDRNIFVWNSAPPELRCAVRAAHNDWINDIALLEGDKSIVATGSNDFSVKVKSQ